MRFKLDENLPLDLAADLYLAGHDADTVADEAPLGPICRHSTKELRICSERPTLTHAGVVLFRPEFIRSRLAEFIIRELAGRVTFVSERRVRVH